MKAAEHGYAHSSRWKAEASIVELRERNVRRGKNGWSASGVRIGGGADRRNLPWRWRTEYLWLARNLHTALACRPNCGARRP